MQISLAALHRLNVCNSSPYSNLADILVEYRKRPRYLEKYCLVDFASKLQIEYPKDVTFDDPFDDNVDDEPMDPYDMNITDEFIMKSPNAIVIKKQNNAQMC